MNRLNSLVKTPWDRRKAGQATVAASALAGLVVLLRPGLQWTVSSVLAGGMTFLIIRSIRAQHNIELLRLTTNDGKRDHLGQFEDPTTRWTSIVRKTQSQALQNIQNFQRLVDQDPNLQQSLRGLRQVKGFTINHDLPAGALGKLTKPLLQAGAV